MSAVTELELFNAIKTKLMTAAETLDSTKYTITGSPSFEAATAFPNGRTEKFLDLNGSSQCISFDPSTDVPNIDEIIVVYWIKPDFTQTYSGFRGIFDGYNLANAPTYSGLACNFNKDQDDFALLVGKTPSINVFYTVGETWSVDSVSQHVLLASQSGSLDSGKACDLWIDNSLSVSSTLTSYSSGGTLKNPTDFGRSISAGYGYFDGGVFDFAILDYSMLSATHTDAEIVQALYSNTFNGGSHKFIYELTGAVSFTPKIIII